ncbi:importin subunit beta-1 [Trichomonascus vanleenenianus]|uniref:karyopherin beta n=1 Tax=Trichomonascus vanleenenianus TaxID=2268995 RepID=UPI003ECB3208
MDIAILLENAQKPDQQIRAQAEAELQDAAKNHFVPYLGMLTQVLASAEQRTEVRMLAALNLKNELISKDARKRNFQSERWIALDADAKTQIKRTALEALVSGNTPVSNAAAQLIAAIADIELPRSEWPDLTSVLVANTEVSQPTTVKRASLLAIGYICENADPANAGVASQADGILTAIIQGAHSREPDTSVRVTALNALVNSLSFVRANFATEGERNVVMQVVCEATQSEDSELQASAFGALGRIMSLYYQYMKPYMEQALFGLTVNGMHSKDDMVSSMAVEFWSTVCEEEIDISLQDTELAETGGVPPDWHRENFHFAQSALERILPTLLGLLTRQEEDYNDDDWSVAMAAGACLQLFAQNTGNFVVQPTLDFVSKNIVSPNWQEREAAVMAFGSILDGPDPQQLKTLIGQALPPLLGLMKDQSLHVKDTVAWCIGRMADLVIEGINIEQDLPQIIDALLYGLRDHPKVSTNCCWTIINLVEQLNQEGPRLETSEMSRYYQPLVEALLNSASRDNNEASSRTSAYEALSTMVIFSPHDVVGIVETLSSGILGRLEQTLEMQKQIVSTDDRAVVEELQINLLGLLTNIIRRIGDEVLSGADKLMLLFLQLLENRLPNSLTEEDVFIAIGAVAMAINENFQKYMDAFMPYLMRALEDTDSQTCNTAIGLVADICHSLGSNVQQYTDTFMRAFMANLQKEDAPKEIKPMILSCIGDIASSVGPQGFAGYLGGVMQVLVEASQIQAAPDSSYDLMEYVDRLRESIVDAYVGIVAGFRDTPDALSTYVPTVFQFLSMIQNDFEFMKRESIIRSVVGLIGDIAQMYSSGTFATYYRESWVTDLIRRARDRTFSSATKDTARWAREQQKLQQQIA